MQGIREEEQSICNSLTMRNSPRIVVLVPTNELCAQARSPRVSEPIMA